MITWDDIIQFAKTGNPTPKKRVEKTPKEWADLLTPEQYSVTRNKGTERAFTGEYCESYGPGEYSCVCCGTPLFNAGEKFESGSGWPSFTQPLRIERIKYHVDHSFGIERVEVMCNTCDAHLGHVFPDGPEPSGLRYCINSVSLKKGETGTQHPLES
ncbi:MAG: peptide-methionine (R)-S-oxide reductase MsrB [Cyclobacteriaceae bacterium]|nr:peptide-methionine (R)-S-oxide reductase MsrB [Cyclobacteriaceae bacterium]